MIGPIRPSLCQCSCGKKINGNEESIGIITYNKGKLKKHNLLMN